MIKRTIEISAQPLHLAVRHEQLVLRPVGQFHDPVASIPCEDIGVVIVDNAASTYSHAALARLIDHGAVLVVCDERHLPAGVLLPMGRNSEMVWRLDEQIALSRPRRKRLWQQIVVAKVRNQAANLAYDPAAQKRLLALARNVRSGDPTNVEAQAARIYWDAWLDDGVNFRRDSDGLDPINSQLNYGYAVLRAAVARALVSAGLHPALGLHHANRGNAFCLADDFIEPLRPLVDRAVRDLAGAGVQGMDRAAKTRLLGLLAGTVRLRGQTGPLMVQLARSVASLARCIRQDQKKLDLIELIDPAEQSWTSADTE